MKYWIWYLLKLAEECGTPARKALLQGVFGRYHRSVPYRILPQKYSLNVYDITRVSKSSSCISLISRLNRSAESLNSITINMSDIMRGAFHFACNLIIDPFSAIYSRTILMNYLKTLPKTTHSKVMPNL